MLTVCSGETDPSRREHAQLMPVREQRDIAVALPRTVDHPIDSYADLLRILPARTSVAEDHPSMLHVIDLLRRQSFVFAIVPLAQIGLDDSLGAQAGQRAGFARPLQRTDEDTREPLPGQPGSQCF